MKKLHIQVYTSFRTETYLYVKGRLLKDEPKVIKPNQGIISSIFYTLIRAMSREIKQCPVSCQYGTQHYNLVTDKEGYFEIYDEAIHDESCPNVMEITAQSGERSGREVIALDDMSHDVPVGVISDIDDTIMVTGVKSFFKIKVILNTIFLNPFRRKPIEAAADAFHYLSEHVQGVGPVIYLSNSPWNLYNYLKTFLSFNGFPEGLVLLRDMGLQLLRSKKIEERNKYIEIEKLLLAFPNTNFILVGDTGELDFDIYEKVEAKYPDRILKILLNKAGNRKKENFLESFTKSHSKYIMLEGFSEVPKLSMLK